VFDPGLGRIRAGFLVSRYGFNFAQTDGIAQKQTARENPAPGCGTYSGPQPRVKENWPEKALKRGDLGQKRRMASSEWRTRKARCAIRYSPFAIRPW
jgi:hypothetical protein